MEFLSYSDLIAGLGLVFQPSVLLAIPVGVLIGFFFGMIPGVSGGTALALVLSFVIFMDPVTAIVLMVSIYAADNYGGSLTAILLKIPGTGAATATMVDGYQLTLQGRAGEAIAVSRAGAFVGGTVGALFLLLAAPLIGRWALNFGPAEFLALAIFGVTIVAALSEGSLPKALISGWLGFLIATIGMDPLTGHGRFTFGSLELADGVNLVWVVVGMFAISQAFALISGMDTSRRYEGRLSVPWGWAWPEVWRRRRIAVMGSITGLLVGIIPGAGGTIAAWTAYNQAQRFSKEKEKVGKGSLDGVLAPEAANDSVAGGTLIPTMTLGVPGSSNAAIILGGLMLAGMRPGPRLMDEQAPQAVAVMIGFLLANIVFLVLAMVFMRALLGVLRIPPPIWPAVIVILGAFGAFVIEERAFGALIAVVLGIVAFGMRRVGLPLAPALLGFVLGPIVEQNAARVVAVAGGDYAGFFLSRPIAMTFLALAALAVGADLYTKLRRRRETAGHAP